MGEFTGERKAGRGGGENQIFRRRQPELMIPQGNVNLPLEHMENGKGEIMPVAPGDGHTVWLPVPKIWRCSMRC